MASVRTRIEDALLLWQTGRQEGAFLCALIAVAATAKRRYPRSTDRQAFEQFLTDHGRARVSVEYRGECHPIEHIFYKWFRCQIVHEGSLPSDIEFLEDVGPGFSVRAGGAPDYVLKVGTGWFAYIIDSVRYAPENAAEFAR